MHFQIDNFKKCIPGFCHTLRNISLIQWLLLCFHHSHALCTESLPMIRQFIGGWFSNRKRNDSCYRNFFRIGHIGFYNLFLKSLFRFFIAWLHKSNHIRSVLPAVVRIRKTASIA